jgi:gamma-glutamylcyclotransferase (GGCT)/AIG2-like uncharacterized protein YtfP
MKKVNNIKVFVYGSLRKGLRLNHILTDKNSTFLSEGMTKDNFYVHDLGQFPGLEKNKAGVQVFGEVWLVNEDCLLYLDIVEGVPTLYERKVCKIITNDTGTVSCFMYELSHKELQSSSNIVDVQDWKTYYEEKNKNS